MVMVALPVPVPEHVTVLLVMVTGNPELAVAATVKLLPTAAFAGAGVVTVIICPLLVVLLTCGAAR